MGHFAKQLRPSLRFRPVVEALEDRLCPTAVALLPPTLLSVTAVSGTKATVTWSKVANETGYNVLLWNGSAAVPVATVGANVTTTTVSGLPGGQEVWLQVEAFNATSDADSAWHSVNLPISPLSGATALQATASSPTEIDLRWTTAQGQTGYQVLEWNGTKAVTVATLAAGTHKDAVTGLTPATTYYFSIESFNDTTSTTTDWVTIATPPQPITAPTNLTYTSTDTQVTLKWTTGQGATGYEVYEWENGQAVQVAQTNAQTTQAVVTGLQPGTAYWFYVQDYNASNSAGTPWKSIATTAVSDPLLPPTNVQVQVTGSGQVTVTWAASAGAVGYWVYDYVGGSWHIVANPGATATSAAITGLKDVSQYFLVMAYTADGVQDASSKMVAVTV